MYFEIDDYNALKRALERMCARLAEENVPVEKVFDSKLVANELVANALQHGGGRAYFRAEVRGDEICIRVQSAVRFCPPAASSCAAREAECGRGLFLVDMLGESRTYSEEEGICVVIRIQS